MARKRYNKRKRRLCGLCRPQKKGISKRWSGKELQRLHLFEQTLHRGGDWAEQ